MSDVRASLAIKRLTMRTRAVTASTLTRLSHPAGQVIPYAVGGVSIIAGVLAILLWGSELPRITPKPLVIMVPAQLPPPTLENFGIKPPAKHVAAVEPALAQPLSQSTVVAQQTETAVAPRRIEGFEQPMPGTSTNALPRVVDPALTSLAPAGSPDSLERIEPRAPLSELYTKPPASEEAKLESLPEPDPQADKEKWRMTRMFYPVASAAGRLEAKGHKMALAGLEPLQIDEKCVWNGNDWPCGTVARTAFRSWLRARAVQCKVPAVPLPDEITAECHIGRTDIGEWLVSNGWARAATGGPYAGLGDKAKARNAGIYGAPPKRVGVRIAAPHSPPSPGTGMDSVADLPHSTPDELNQDPQPGGLWPQIDP